MFTEKVLKRLFPDVSSGRDKGTPQPAALETPPKNATPEAVQHTHVHRLAGKDGSQGQFSLHLTLGVCPLSLGLLCRTHFKSWQQISRTASFSTHSVCVSRLDAGHMGLELPSHTEATM